MPYTAEISRSNPGCFIFLIDQSGSMGDSMAGSEGKRKADAVADAINRLLHNLIIRCTKSEGVLDRFHIGIIGYGDNVRFALPGMSSGQALVAISQIESSPLRIEERIKKVDDGAGGLVNQTIKFSVWFEPVAYGGTPMCQAMDEAHRILQSWVSQHETSFPPIVINITDGESTDGDPTSHAKSITNLATNDGNVLLFNCHISSKSASPIVFPDNEKVLPDQFALMLFNISSILPESMRKTAISEGFQVSEKARGFAFNADLVELINFLDIGTRPANLR